MLGRHDRLNDGGDVVDVGQGLDAEEDVVKGCFRAACGLFGGAYDCVRVSYRDPRVGGD